MPLILQFQLLFSKNKVSRSLLDGVSFIHLLHIVCIHCILQACLDVLKLLRCHAFILYLAFWCYLAFLRVDLAFFAYDTLTTLIICRQRWIQFEWQNSPSRASAVDDKIDTSFCYS